MTKQAQSVNGDGEAYQAARDLTIHNGFSSEQMAEIMVHLSMQLAVYFSKAEAKVNERFVELRESVVLEFSKPENKKAKEAFAEPDFQDALRDAHSSFVRSGDADLKKRLVELLLRRANEQTGTRRALLLNQAIGKSVQLTADEQAALSLIFIVKHTGDTFEYYIQALQFIKEMTEPFVERLPLKSSCIEYLEVVGWAFIQRLSSFNVWENFNKRWQHLFTDGFSNADIAAITKGEYAIPFEAFVPIQPPLNFNLRFRSSQDAEIRETLSKMGAPAEQAEALLALNNRARWNADRIRSEFIRFYPQIERLETFYAMPEAGFCYLNPLGKTLAHSVLVGKVGFSADLSAWVD